MKVFYGATEADVLVKQS